MAAIGFIYAWQKLYPVLIFRSVTSIRYFETDQRNLKGLSHGAIFLATCNAILLLRDAN